jgi:hypothetical protein
MLSENRTEELVKDLDDRLFKKAKGQLLLVQIRKKGLPRNCNKHINSYP